MLVVDASLWPNGDAGAIETLGRIAIGRVGVSVGGDFADYLVVHTDSTGAVTKSRLLRRRHVMAGWQDLLWAALDGEGSELVSADDLRVATVVAKLNGESRPQL